MKKLWKSLQEGAVQKKRHKNVQSLTEMQYTCSIHWMHTLQTLQYLI